MRLSEQNIRMLVGINDVLVLVCFTFLPFQFARRYCLHITEREKYMFMLKRLHFNYTHE